MRSLLVSALALAWLIASPASAMKDSAAVNALHAAISAAGVPLVGVSVGDWNDKSTWRVDFEPPRAPTGDEKVKIDAVKARFDTSQF